MSHRRLPITLAGRLVQGSSAQPELGHSNAPNGADCVHGGVGVYARALMCMCVMAHVHARVWFKQFGTDRLHMMLDKYRQRGHKLD